jgi:hypothetical protein
MNQFESLSQAMTLRIYAHVMSHDEGEREALRALVEGAEISALNRHQSPETVSQEVG